MSRRRVSNARSSGKEEGEIIIDAPLAHRDDSVSCVSPSPAALGYHHAGPQFFDLLRISCFPMTASRYFALVPAAGIGARMESACPKQYLPLAGKPMLRHVVETFAATSVIEHTFVVVSATDGFIHDLMSDGPDLGDRVSVLFDGGATRQHSVLNGLRAMHDRAVNDDWILVHDAARPGLTTALINTLIDALRDDGIGGLLAVPVVDTLKRADDTGRAQSTLSRDGLWAAQTPQMFRYGLLRQALEQTDNCTDEASAIEALGLRPRLVAGSPRNFKVTLPQDAALAEIYLKGTS